MLIHSPLLATKTIYLLACIGVNIYLSNSCKKKVMETKTIVSPLDSKDSKLKKNTYTNIKHSNKNNRPHGNGFGDITP